MGDGHVTARERNPYPLSPAFAEGGARVAPSNNRISRLGAKLADAISNREKGRHSINADKNIQDASKCQLNFNVKNSSAAELQRSTSPSRIPLRNRDAAASVRSASDTASLILQHLLYRRSVADIPVSTSNSSQNNKADNGMGLPPGSAPFLPEEAEFPRVETHPVQVPMSVPVIGEPPTKNVATLSTTNSLSGGVGTWSAQKAFSVLMSQLPEILLHGLFEQLRVTLDQYVCRITPSEAERDAKRTLFNAFADFLRRAMQDRIAISVAGSTAYEVDAKGSDLDVVLLTNWGAPLYVLQSIVQYLQMTQAVQNSSGRPSSWPLRNVHLQLVDSARVPVLTVTTPHGLVCDVSVNTLNSVKHTEFFKKVVGSNSHLRRMMRLLKYWAKVRKLPTMKEGGLPGIVWMLLAAYFGSCPAHTFLAAIREPAVCEHTGTRRHNTNNVENQKDVEVSEALHSALSKVAPLFAALFQFFKLCGSRRLMTRTISCTGKYCAKKDPQEVAERVSSAQNYNGVWDEVVSVEDPAVTVEPVYPSAAAWVDSKTLKANTEDIAGKGTSIHYGRMHSSSSGIHASSRFQPGISTDLAAKISSATWIVYMMELKRGASILTRLLHFINDAKKKVENLPDLMNLNVLSDSTAQVAKEAGKCDFVADNSGGAGCPAAGKPVAAVYEQTARDYMARQLRHHVAFLCEESFSDRFVLPGCDERLRQIVDAGSGTTAESQRPGETKSGGSTVGKSETKNLLDIEWGSSGMAVESNKPFCTCCSTPRNEFAVVLLHGRLHVLRMTSICTDWTSWWTKDFLSRRDVRSVVHGTLHQIVHPQEYIPYVQEIGHDHSKYIVTDLPPTGFPCGLSNKQTNRKGWQKEGQACPSEKTPYPCLLLPVRNASDSSPVEILFHPCDFVCRLKGWKIPYCPDQDALLVDDVFYLESDEYNYMKEMSKVASEAPWYYQGDNFGLKEDSRKLARENGLTPQPSFQPAAFDCARCGIDGDAMDTLEDTTGYQCPKGAFQFSNWLADDQERPEIGAGTVKMIQAAWRRWVAHVQATDAAHSAGLKTDEAEDGVGACTVVDEPPVITAELTRATQLLAATIDALRKRSVTLQTLSSQGVSSSGSKDKKDNRKCINRSTRPMLSVRRRCRSLPDRLTPDLVNSPEANGYKPYGRYQRVPSHILRGVVGMASFLSQVKRGEIARYIPPSKRGKQPAELNTLPPSSTATEQDLVNNPSTSKASLGTQDTQSSAPEAERASLQSLEPQTIQTTKHPPELDKVHSKEEPCASVSYSRGTGGSTGAVALATAAGPAPVLPSSGVSDTAADRNRDAGSAREAKPCPSTGRHGNKSKWSKPASIPSLQTASASVQDEWESSSASAAALRANKITDSFTKGSPHQRSSLVASQPIRRRTPVNSPAIGRTRSLTKSVVADSAACASSATSPSWLTRRKRHHSRASDGQSAGHTGNESVAGFCTPRSTSASKNCQPGQNHYHRQHNHHAHLSSSSPRAYVDAQVQAPSSASQDMKSPGAGRSAVQLPSEPVAASIVTPKKHMNMIDRTNVDASRRLLQSALKGTLRGNVTPGTNCAGGSSGGGSQSRMNPASPSSQPGPSSVQGSGDRSLEERTPVSNRAMSRGKTGGDGNHQQCHGNNNNNNNHSNNYHYYSSNTHHQSQFHGHNHHYNHHHHGRKHQHLSQGGDAQSGSYGHSGHLHRNTSAKNGHNGDSSHLVPRKDDPQHRHVASLNISGAGGGTGNVQNNNINPSSESVGNPNLNSDLLFRRSSHVPQLSSSSSSSSNPLPPVVAPSHEQLEKRE